MPNLNVNQNLHTKNGMIIYHFYNGVPNMFRCSSAWKILIQNRYRLSAERRRGSGVANMTIEMTIERAERLIIAVFHRTRWSSCTLKMKSRLIRQHESDRSKPIGGCIQIHRVDLQGPDGRASARLNCNQIGW